MVTRDIRKLLERLNPYCQKLLETAVGYCVNRGHYELRWEHLFIQALDDNDNDIQKVLTYFKVEPSELKKQLNRELEQLQSGSTGKPSFSPPLLEVLEQAWTNASLGLSLPAVRSGVILMAAIERGLVGMSSYADALRPVSVPVLTEKFGEITSGSIEDQGRVAGAPGGVQSGAEGESVLDQFCTNFTKDAREGKIDQILGRDDEIRQSIDILNRRRKNNPILVGEAGVGKTAIIEGIALRIARDDVPDSLKNVTIWGLDLGLLQAGASVKGAFEKRLKDVIDAIKNSPTPTILFIDEAHTLIGAGGSAGQNDAANLLKPALARGELRTMAATTWAEYRKYFEKDPALARRFQLVKIDEPDEETCMTMLRGVGESYRKYHGVRITDDGIRAAVTLSHRYISGRQLPDKAVDVLDTACARVKMSQTAKPAALDRAERELANAQLKLGTLRKDLDAGVITSDEPIKECEDVIETHQKEIAELTENWEKQKTAAAKVVELQDTCDKLREKGEDGAEELQTTSDELRASMAELERLQGNSPMVFPYVSGGVCGQVVSDWTGVPIGNMVKDEAETLLTLENKLRERVVGQDDALGEVANTIRAAKTGMRNPDAPMGVFLFVGPSGVGKTESALALADLLFGGEKFTTVINMSEYQEKHTVSQLKGSPPGYVGYGEGGVLTEAVRQKPYSIVILDEVEKAHLEVMNLFYQVFDKGFMRDGEGREINFRNTVIILTSNLASDRIVELATQEDGTTSSEINETIRPILSHHFQPALLARCAVVPFWPLGMDVMRDIVRMKLAKIAKRIEQTHGIAMTYADELVEGIAQQCTTIESGARNADAIIGQTILPAISMRLLENMGNEEAAYTKIVVGADEEGNLGIDFQ